MTVRTFLIATIAALFLSWGIWVLVITMIDPVSAGWAGLLLFFLALSLAVASTAALIGYGIRRLLRPIEMSSYRVRPAMRQGVLLGFFSVALLFLQLQRLLRWWITIIIIVLFLMVEFGFLSYDRVVKAR